MPRLSVKKWSAGCRLMLVLLGLLVLQACSVELYSQLNQRQANEIVAALVRHGIPAQRQAAADGKMTVMVGKGHFAEAMTVLQENGLPRQEFATLGQVFERDGLVSSPVEERAAMIFGLSQELSQTISDIDGVLSARVHLVLPENDPLRQQLVPSSASVFIRHRAAVSMGAFIPKVKMLVANGVAGLDYDKVSVVLAPVETSMPAATGEMGFTTFLGLWLHPDSVARAMGMFYGLCLVVLLLGGRLAYLHWRQRERVYALSAPAPAPAKKS